MPEDKEPAPLEGELVPTNTGESTDLIRIVNEMVEQMQKAAVGLLSQNVRDVEAAALAAKALYHDASKRRASAPDLRLVAILRDMTCLYSPLTRAIVFQIEGRFSEALEELAKGRDASAQAIANIDEYSKLPDADQTVVPIWQPILSIFLVLFRGLDASLRAEVIGYQGQIPQYTKLLSKAAAEYRQAEGIPPSLNPVFLTLVGMCTTNADRLKTRAAVFNSGWIQGQRYLTPTGARIFIIHGHDEAKWRELQSLLKDEFNLDAVVLKGEPGAGETLIQKFEKVADDCCYAFALLTLDDFIEKGGKSYFQARPNVLFELGWFYGHFGRDRVCIVKRTGAEIPSDLGGILSIDFHDDVSEGLVKIRAELQRVGIIAGDARRQTGRAKKATHRLGG